MQLGRIPKKGELVEVTLVMEVEYADVKTPYGPDGKESGEPIVEVAGKVILNERKDYVKIFGIPLSVVELFHR